ncbi:MAG: FxDxF family PEP-CTERM protein [Phenylobacterium sp.]
MKTLFCATAVAVAMFAAGTAANAAQTITFDPPAADGSFTGDFGNTGIGSGAFTNTFTFNMPTGIAAGTISSIFTTNLSNNIDFTSVTLDGNPFDINSSGQVEFRSINNVLVTDGPQSLVVSGTSGGNGSYSGTLSFETAGITIGGAGGVPEPAAWALMIVGFGGVGATLRARRRAAHNAVAA